jgi:hypothetical protein
MCIRTALDPVGTSGKGHVPAQPAEVLPQFQLLDLLQKYPVMILLQFTSIVERSINNNCVIMTLFL